MRLILLLLASSALLPSTTWLRAESTVITSQMFKGATLTAATKIQTSWTAHPRATTNFRVAMAVTTFSRRVTTGITRA